jgi:hypothetical protein
MSLTRAAMNGARCDPLALSLLQEPLWLRLPLLLPRVVRALPHLPLLSRQLSMRSDRRDQLRAWRKAGRQRNRRYLWSSMLCA